MIACTRLFNWIGLGLSALIVLVVAMAESSFVALSFLLPLPYATALLGLRPAANVHVKRLAVVTNALAVFGLALLAIVLIIGADGDSETPIFPLLVVVLALPSGFALKLLLSESGLGNRTPNVVWQPIEVQTISALSPLVPERAKPSMFVYSGLFAVVYVGGAFGLSSLVEAYAPNPDANLSSFAHMLSLLGAMFSGWVFARRHNRLFTWAENTRVVAFCICWVFLLQGFIVLAYADEFEKLSRNAFVGILAFSFGLDALVVWGSFRYVVKKFMTRRINQAGGAQAAKKSVLE